MGKQGTKEKPIEVVHVECGGLSYLHKDFQYHCEGIFIDKEDSAANWRYKYVYVPIVEEIDGQEVVRQDDVCIFDTSEWGKRMGMPQK